MRSPRATNRRAKPPRLLIFGCLQGTRHQYVPVLCVSDGADPVGCIHSQGKDQASCAQRSSEPGRCSASVKEQHLVTSGDKVKRNEIRLWREEAEHAL